MKTIQASEISRAVSELVQTANLDLDEDFTAALKDKYEEEESPVGKDILKQILDNAEISRTERMPMCQDTGFAVFWVELGQDVHIEGGLLGDAIDEGVESGYKDAYLRKSIVDPPIFERKNTGTNTPAIAHINIVAGDNLKISVAPKGGGSENMSRQAMLKPADGVEGVKKFVIDSISQAGGNPCPPIIVGVGIGGTFEKSAILSKYALFRHYGKKNPDPRICALEDELFQEINKLGIGPMGMGGTTTAMAVHVETFPCHLASLPVAINIQCHAARHKEIIL
jgi:fumarate hydratase subunit alpha